MPEYGGALPWLQDTADQNVWGSWGASDRDVFILDGENNFYATFKVSWYPLQNEVNREALKAIFLRAAQAEDTDQDGVPDCWEMQYLGDLSYGFTDDTDMDDVNNFEEFAWGTNPMDPGSRPRWKPEITTINGQRYLTLTFRRWAGSMVNYTVEASDDLITWSSSASKVVLMSGPRNLYDGSGNAEVSYRLAEPLGAKSFLRVRAEPRIP